MKSAIEFLVWEINHDTGLKGYLLTKISKKTTKINTNTSDIKIDYLKKTVEIYNASESAKNFLQVVTLNDFMKEISK